MSIGQRHGVAGAPRQDEPVARSQPLTDPGSTTGAASQLGHLPVAAVIPCYRCHGTIERAVRSVVEQTAPPEELWLVDDASPDGGATLAELHALQERFGRRLHIEVLRLPVNGGPAVARNAGWDSTRLPFVAFLDADDSWHPRKLDIQYRWMRGHPESAATGHALRYVDGIAEPTTLPMAWGVRRIERGQLLRSNQVSTPTILLRRDLPYRFDSRLRSAEDFHLWAEIVLDGHGLHVLELPLAYTHKPVFGADGLSARLWDMERGELGHYRLLRRKGQLSRLSATALGTYSLLKYVRRWLLCRMTHP